MTDPAYQRYFREVSECAYGLNVALLNLTTLGYPVSVTENRHKVEGRPDTVFVIVAVGTERKVQ